MCPSTDDVRERGVCSAVVRSRFGAQAVDDVDDCAVGDRLAFGPVSPAVEGVDLLFGGFESFGVVAPAFDLVVAVVVTSCRGQVRPRRGANFAGRSGSVLGLFEALGGFGESRIGIGELAAGLASTEAAGVVEVALCGTPRVLGLFHVFGGRVDDGVEWFARGVGRGELSFGGFDGVDELLSPGLGVVEGLSGVAVVAGGLLS